MLKLEQPLNEDRRTAEMTESESFIWEEVTKKTAIHAQMLETYIKKFMEEKGLPIQKIMLIEHRQENGRISYWIEEKTLTHEKAAEILPW